MDLFFYILPLLLIGLLFFLFNWLMGYRKGHIVLDLDDRYFDHRAYMLAIQEKLERDGHTVSYEGYSRFIIDGKRYLMLERNISMGGVPMQRTILKPIE
ncbi:hypothetical protein [Aquibacillus sediminis]|uniref:hypothetical protein n=1 Tax=Aquibacillus sediminis TaxID=2574734 RepID=UPI001108D0AB|nr:hypothetical protein [Aquibacillus sediminis]